MVYPKILIDKYNNEDFMDQEMKKEEALLQKIAQ